VKGAENAILAGRLRNNLLNCHSEEVDGRRIPDCLENTQSEILRCRSRWQNWAIFPAVCWRISLVIFAGESVRRKTREWFSTLLALQMWASKMETGRAKKAGMVRKSRDSGRGSQGFGVRDWGLGIRNWRLGVLDFLLVTFHSSHVNLPPARSAGPAVRSCGIFSQG
jgi:hypothetical protein